MTTTHSSKPINGYPEETDVWFAKYRPFENPSVDLGWTFDDKNFLFDTHGLDVERVKKADPMCIWTLIDGEDGQYLIAGYHLVNRVGYCLTEVPFTDPNEIYLDHLYEESEEEAA